MPPLIVPAPVADAPLPAACLNCSEPLPPPRPRFCPACGQETHLRPPRIGEFIQQFGGAYFATEGALWRTLKWLLFKPGELKDGVFFCTDLPAWLCKRIQRRIDLKPEALAGAGRGCCVRRWCRVCMG